MRFPHVWRGWVLIISSLAAAAAAQGPAAEEGPWRCLLKRTALAEEALTSTLYVADLAGGEVTALATFDDFDVAAAAADARGETVLVAGYPYGVPAKTVRVYSVDVASRDYNVVCDFDYPQLPEVAVVYEEKEGAFYVAAWGKMDPYRRSDGLPIYATFVYRYDATSSEITPFNVYDRELALVGAGGGVLYASTMGYNKRDFQFGQVFVYLDADSGAINYTDFVADEGLSREKNRSDSVEDEGLLGALKRERPWFTGPSRYPPETGRHRPIYYYSLDLFKFIGGHIDVYVNDSADSTGYRMLEVDWRALDISYSYLRDAAVYLVRGHGGKPTEVVVTYADGTAGSRIPLPPYEPAEAIKINEVYDLSFNYSLLYVE